MAPAQPRTFGRYELVRRLGGAGACAVHLATDRGDATLRVIKQLPSRLAADDDFGRRFARESARLLGLEAPHLVPTVDAGVVDGTPFVATAYVPGADLRALLRAGRLSPGDTVVLVGQVAEALAALHAVGVVHRDVTPGNVLVRDRSAAATPLDALLTDVGLARPDARNALEAGTGLAVGAFPYMAPERLAESPTDATPAADVYALACLAVECLTGRRAFVESWPAVACEHHAHPRPRVADRRPELAEADAVLATALAVDPAERPDPITFARELAAALSTPGRAPRAEQPKQPERAERAEQPERAEQVEPAEAAPEPIPPPASSTPPTTPPTTTPTEPRRPWAALAAVASPTNVVGAGVMALAAAGGAVLHVATVPHVIATLAGYGVGAAGAQLVTAMRRGRADPAMSER